MTVIGSKNASRIVFYAKQDHKIMIKIQWNVTFGSMMIDINITLFIVLLLVNFGLLWFNFVVTWLHYFSSQSSKNWTNCNTIRKCNFFGNYMAVRSIYPSTKKIYTFIKCTERESNYMLGSQLQDHLYAVLKNFNKSLKYCTELLKFVGLLND